MTLTVVVGASGSGKTTFLNDVAKQHQCTYIRQYHGIRPYITISKIPRFDPTELLTKQTAYWSIYEREKTASTIKAGGTMAGKFTAGLSGGQRKLLLLELLYQRTAHRSDLLLVLDEPFAGVTDDFVPFIIDRLDEIRRRHNILLVTNDHVATLIRLADNTITVSATNRTLVQLNDNKTPVDRSKLILALGVGGQYHCNKANGEDLRFFYNVEVAQNGSLFGVAVFTIVAFAVFLATFWQSSPDHAPLLMVAATVMAFFCVNPYLLSLVEWRNYMNEEAEALLHASCLTTNKVLKSILALVLILAVALAQWGVVNVVIERKPGHFAEFQVFVGIFMDSVFLFAQYKLFSIFTRWPDTTVQISATLPYLLMILLSGIYSPSAGLPVLKQLRYLFPRFYLFCMLPGVTPDYMED